MNDYMADKIVPDGSDAVGDGWIGTPAIPFGASTAATARESTFNVHGFIGGQSFR